MGYRFFQKLTWFFAAGIMMPFVIYWTALKIMGAFSRNNLSLLILLLTSYCPRVHPHRIRIVTEFLQQKVAYGLQQGPIYLYIKIGFAD